LAAARQYLEHGKEREFDPACVDAFLSRWEEVVEISTAQKVTPVRKPAKSALPAAIQRPVESPAALLAEDCPSSG
jgi:putative two-component system response regulator